ncbi:MAG: dihydroorotate dehydrogenase electron transfer subunit [Gammaproteobacteria bacterium]|nr:dihydroorotate dehydrogenase electron transfer subunit [Gammaproteobacteria bacterium]
MREIGGTRNISGPFQHAPDSDSECLKPIAEMICPVFDHQWLNDDYKHLVVEAPVRALAAQPGQFFHLLCRESDDVAPYLRRPMSVYRIDRDQGRIEFLYKVVGEGTRILAELKPGDGLNAVGPLGRGFDLSSKPEHILLLARGVGLATLAPLAEAARERGIGVDAILSARSSDVLMSVDYLRQSSAIVTTVTDDPDDTHGDSGVDKVEEMVRHIAKEKGTGLFATCGSNRLLQMLRKVGVELGISGQVALEQQMGCGLGMCYCCVRPFQNTVGEIDYRRVCIDGPVFDLQETVSW